MPIMVTDLSTFCAKDFEPNTHLHHAIRQWAKQLLKTVYYINTVNMDFLVPSPLGFIVIVALS